MTFNNENPSNGNRNSAIIGLNFVALSVSISMKYNNSSCMFMQNNRLAQFNDLSCLPKRLNYAYLILYVTSFIKSNQKTNMIPKVNADNET